MDQPAPDTAPSPQSPSPSARPSSSSDPSSAAASLAADIGAKLHPSTTAPDGRPLVAAIAQDATSGRVLMLAWMDAAALAQTLRTGIATYYSRSRQELWVKGATSGNTQRVLGVELDCDGDAVLLRVIPAGPACHTGLESCFDTLELALA